MDSRQMTEEQKRKVLDHLAEKIEDHRLCSCKDPMPRIKNGHYYIDHLTASLGTEPVAIIAILCENCGRLTFYDQDFLGIKTR